MLVVTSKASCKARWLKALHFDIFGHIMPIVPTLSQTSSGALGQPSNFQFNESQMGFVVLGDI